MDEPALREGLPLKANRWDGYLSWAVDAFRVTCATAKPETQIVTHLCYRYVVHCACIVTMPFFQERHARLLSRLARAMVLVIAADIIK